MTDPAARRFEGKVVLITGAAGGIGRATGAVNVKGVWLGIKTLAPLLRARGAGVIVNTASIAGLRGSRNLVAYTASKHAVVGLTRTAALELAPAGTIPLRRYGQPGGSRGPGGVPLQRGRGLHHRRDLHGGRRLDGPSHSARAARGHEPRSPTPGFSAAGTGQASAAAVSSFWSAGITSLAKKRRLRSASSYGMPA